MLNIPSLSRSMNIFLMKHFFLLCAKHVNDHKISISSSFLSSLSLARLFWIDLSFMHSFPFFRLILSVGLNLVASSSYRICLALLHCHKAVILGVFATTKCFHLATFSSLTSLCPSLPITASQRLNLLHNMELIAVTPFPLSYEVSGSSSNLSYSLLVYCDSL